ncbi:DNA polymerase III (Subunit gamma/tau) DnaZX domain protein [Mycobacterium kansasii 824]|nr:DNA polymerase III (Subunit gamma/tau) DnaZX domain protein [Mycobacterium kansasii 824]
MGGPEPVAASVPAKAEEVVPEIDSAQPREDEEESMLAEASRNNPSEPRRDPEEAALELLRSELGARPID